MPLPKKGEKEPPRSQRACPGWFKIFTFFGFLRCPRLCPRGAFRRGQPPPLPYGILTLSKPLSKEIVLQSLLLLSATHERLARAEDEKAALSAKIEELRLINRAKCVLIDQLRMSEADAHHYIEKQAMDRCISRRAMAEKILSAYR